ncbi:MAG: biotin transporter BioY [Candidatus Baltobacteraceae bacterium]
MIERSTSLASLPAWARTITLVLAGSALMALSAQVSIPLPFSPVPISGQTFGVVLVVALLGTRQATLAMIAYLIEGASGLPVFAEHAGGALWLLGPSAGYLWSFPLAAYVTGWLLDRGLSRTFAGRLAAVATGTAAVFAFGWAWLAHVLANPATALALGVVPFVVGDVVKTLLAAAIMPALGLRAARKS